MVEPRIVFLGSDLNPISRRCLAALVETDKYRILVGIDGGHGSFARVLKATWKRHGTRGLLRRVGTKVVAAARMKLRGTGLDVGPPASLKELLRCHQLSGFDCSPVNSEATVGVLRSFEPDLIVVANFSQIIRGPIASIPRLGIINLHPSLLPNYRGPMPYYWVIENREMKSGVTVHYIDDGVDTGDIIAQAEHEVVPGDTEFTLRQRSIELAAPLLVDTVQSVLDGTATRTKQNAEEATYFGFAPPGASRI